MINNFQRRESLSEVTSDTLVLTANRRLSRFYESLVAKDKLSRAENAWPALPVMSINAWFKQQWQLVVSGRLHKWSSHILLSPAQETLLWQRLFSENNQGFELLNEVDTAAQACDAWRQLRLWNVSLEELPDYTETRFLKALVGIFQKHSADHFLLDEVAVMAAVVEVLVQGKLAQPSKVLLYGFQDYSPKLLDFLHYWQRNGVEILEFDPACESSEPYVSPSADENEELECAAAWAKDILNQSPEGRRDEISIAIVVPELTRLRKKVERIFYEYFEPQYTFSSQPRHSPGFNISAAVPLCDTPLVAAALEALELNRNVIDAAILSRVLLSPFISSFEELGERAELQKDLLAGESSLSRVRLYAACADKFESTSDKTRQHKPEFYKALQDFRRLSKKIEKKYLSPLEWAKIFQAQLQALAWPGSRASDTMEYQQLQKWPEVLEIFSGLDLVLESDISFSEALYLLRYCAKLPFQAQTTSSPIQVLGLLEAGALRFDYLRVLQMDDTRWPMPDKPNPFIPLALQKSLSMPRSSPDVELRYAQKLTTELKKSAEQVVFSYACHEEDRELNCSPLLRDLPIRSESFIELSPDYFELIAKQNSDMQTLINDSGSAIASPASIKGGTQILKDQAACQFRAYARHRLGVEADEKIEAGIGARERGILIHQSLDYFWRKLKSQENLLALSEKDLLKLIDEAVKESMLKLASVRNYGKQLLLLERDRTRQLLLAWMDYEKQRPEFKVLQQEKSNQIVVGGLLLNLRYDRLDQLEDGSHFVIDYKTGAKDLKAWAGERPDEPQIPLYAVANENSLGAAAFALVNKSHLGYKGVTKVKELQPQLKAPEELKRTGLPIDWNEILQHWHATLEKLARSFLQGEAQVNPKNPTVSCRYCGFQSLCRIEEILSEGNSEGNKDKQDSIKLEKEQRDGRHDN